MSGKILLAKDEPSELPRSSARRRRLARASALLGFAAGVSGTAYADPQRPAEWFAVQVVPTFQEPGLPMYSFPTGGSAYGGGSGSGSVEGGSGGSTVSS